MRKSHLIGLPVLDVACGRVLGHVQSILINPASLTAVGLLLKCPGWRGPLLVLEMDRVHRIGKDAVTVKDATQIGRLTDHPEIRDWIEAAAALERARLVTRGGTLVGATADFALDPEQGTISTFVLHRTPWERLVTGERVLPARYVICAGPDAIVVDDQAEAYLAGRSPLATNTTDDVDEAGENGGRTADAPPDEGGVMAARRADRVKAWLSTSVRRGVSLARTARAQVARWRYRRPDDPA